jgi:hypothetical protein
MDARYRGNMALALGMLGRYEESLSLYQQVVSPSDAHFNLAVICDARKDPARAEQEYKLAVDASGVMSRDSNKAASPASQPATAPSPVAKAG